MRDPVVNPFPFLEQLVQPLADVLGLRTIPLHVHEILGSALLYQIIFAYIAPRLSAQLVPQYYKKLPRDGALRWNMHCVSMVQSIMISILTLWTILNDEERKAMTHEERVWGYIGAPALVQALAVGYFLWDLTVMVKHTSVFGLPMLAHASSCFIVFALGYVSAVLIASSISLMFQSGQSSTTTAAYSCYTNSRRRF